jgi:hypothetical protein
MNGDCKKLDMSVVSVRLRPLPALHTCTLTRSESFASPAKGLH